MAFERSKLVLAKAGFLAPLVPGTPSPHIVDRLIEERGEKLVQSPLWPVIRPFLHKVLNYREALRMADDVAPLSGLGGLDYAAARLNLKLDILGSDRIPRNGGFVLAANHPTGLADGIAVFDAIKPFRRDLSIFANRDAIRVNPRFSDVIIPVEWRDNHKSHTKTRETLARTLRAREEGRAIIVVPAGRIAYWADGHLNERPWQTTAVALARRFNLPILPVHVSARNSWLFYWFADWNTELRDMTVFHELLNKRDKRFGITFGQLIATDELAGDLAGVTSRLQHHCTTALAADPDVRFPAAAA